MHFQKMLMLVYVGEKRDHTFVYNAVLGCNSDRTIVYFEITEQMTVFYGEHNPIIELRNGTSLAGSGYIQFYLDRNPIQVSDMNLKLN